MNKRTLIIGSALVVVVYGVTLAGEFIYLRKVFREEYAAETSTLKSEIATLRRQVQEAQALVEARDRTLAALKQSSAPEAERKEQPPLPGHGEPGDGGAARPVQAAWVSVPTAPMEDKPWPIPQVRTVSFAYSTREDIASALEGFVSEFEVFVDEELGAQYREDFGVYISGLRSDPAEATVSQRKEEMLAVLQTQMDGATGERQTEALRMRMERIESADEEDLPGVLNYYQAMADMRRLNELLDEYYISREEMRQAGIEPPPRRGWGPDVMEVAYNLDHFVSIFEPMVDESRRDEYNQDFSGYLTALTTRPADEEVTRRKDEMLAGMRERYATADDRAQRRIETGMQRLEEADLADVRRMMQSEQLRGLDGLIEKYDIPRSDLGQAGGWTRGRRRGPR